MTVGLDISVVVRALIGVPAEQAEAARDAIAVAGRAEVLVSDLVVGETYFALRHHYHVPHGKAIAALRAFLNDPRVQSNGIAHVVLSKLTDRDVAPGLMDRLIHANYAAEGASIITLDRDAAKLSGAKLLTS